MYQITDNLATHGLGETVYPLPENDCAHGELIFGRTNWRIYDARWIKDEPQSKEVFKQALRTLHAMRFGGGFHRIVICCGAGQSRSNALAIGHLVDYYNMDFYDAYNLVHEKVPIAQIEPCHISALKKIFNVGLP